MCSPMCCQGISTLKSYSDGMTAETARETGTQPQGVRDRADVLVDLLGEQVHQDDLDAATKKLSVRVRRLANHVERELRRELAAEGIEVWSSRSCWPCAARPGSGSA